MTGETSSANQPATPGPSSEKSGPTAGPTNGEASGSGASAPAPTPAPENKTTVLEIHGYTVGRTVGQGSYAVVKDAYSRRHKCQVAIKLISKKKAPSDYLAKFLPRELEVVKLLRHPSLVVFLQSIETNNRVYLVMEYACGGDLLDKIRHSKVIPEKQAGRWFGQLVDGMDYCHKKGVVHRDLKCENVLLDEHNNLKITDFGFARAEMKQKQNGEFSMSETYCGSYAYAPPEILTGTPYVPQLADVWSMGVILYVMVIGKLPFDDSNHKKLLKQVNAGPTFPERREISRDCRNLIQRILVKRCERFSIQDIRSHEWFITYCLAYTWSIKQKSKTAFGNSGSSSKETNTPKKPSPPSAPKPQNIVNRPHNTSASVNTKKL